MWTLSVDVASCSKYRLEVFFEVKEIGESPQLSLGFLPAGWLRGPLFSALEFPGLQDISRFAPAVMQAAGSGQPTSGEDCVGPAPGAAQAEIGRGPFQAAFQDSHSASRPKCL